MNTTLDSTDYIQGERDSRGGRHVSNRVPTRRQAAIRGFSAGMAAAAIAGGGAWLVLDATTANGTEVHPGTLQPGTTPTKDVTPSNPPSGGGSTTSGSGTSGGGAGGTGSTTA